MAEILPLHGKYYGTIVKLNNGDEIKMWVGKGVKSERQLEYDDGDPEIDSSHYETKDGFEIASIVCDALTKAGY